MLHKMNLSVVQSNLNVHAHPIYYARDMALCVTLPLQFISNQCAHDISGKPEVHPIISLW